MALPNNLDYFVANAATAFAGEKEKERENAVQKAIAVLSSQGLFAMFLWSYGKGEYKFVAEKFVEVFRNQGLVSFGSADARNVLDTLKKELDRFEKMRFLEDLAMRILIYARHYLKAIA